jgi:LmbE family N-acetylglucosaminyl deacetylase
MVAGEALIHGPGTSERAWAGAPWLADAPYVLPGALLARATRVVVVSPHPDDEVLACGGLLALLAGTRRAVCIVSVTDGEACYPHDARWSPQALGQLRRQELQRALRALGVSAHTVALGVPDGAVAAAHGRVREAVARVLRPGDVVLAPWRHDGHPDHEAAYAAASDAACGAGVRLVEYPVWGWHWGHGTHPRIAATRAVRIALPSAARSAKRAAIACFASQTGDCEPPIDDPVLPPPVLGRFLRDFEVYFP